MELDDPQGQTTDQRREQRLSTLKRLRRGVGAIQQRSHDDIDLQLFGVDTWWEFLELLKVSFAMLPKTSSVFALQLALAQWSGSWNPELTKRREKVSKELGVSVRTVQRLEEEALPLLEHEMDQMSDPLVVRARCLQSVMLLEWAAKRLSPEGHDLNKLGEAVQLIYEGTQPHTKDAYHTG